MKAIKEHGKIMLSDRDGVMICILNVIELFFKYKYLTVIKYINKITCNFNYISNT